jgi:hypothetical protein
MNTGFFKREERINPVLTSSKTRRLKLVTQREGIHAVANTGVWKRLAISCAPEPLK